MKFIKSIVGMAVAMASAGVHADYRAEIGAEIGITKIKSEYERDLAGDFDLDEKTKSAIVGAVVYLTPVITGKGPLAEAAFTGKNSGIGVVVEREKTKDDYDNEYGTYDYDDKMNTLQGHFVVPAGIDLIFDLSAGRGKFDSTDIDTRALGVGAYITPTSTVMLKYNKEEHDTDGYNFDFKYWTLSSHNLLPLQEHLALAIDPQLTVYDYDNDIDRTELGIKAVLYVNRQLGLYMDVLARISKNHNGSDEDGTQAVSHFGIDYFVNEQVHVGAALISVSGEDHYFAGSSGDVDIRTTGFGVALTAAVRI